MSLGRLASPAQAQTDPLQEAWRWVRYGAEDGLPTDRVLDIAETTDGTTWAMTGAELAWFDEYRWHSLRILDGPASRIPSRIVPDLKGSLLTIAGERLYRVDQQGYTRIALPEKADSLLLRDVVPMDDGTLLLLAGGGLFRYHPGGLDAFPAPADITPEEIAHSLFLTDNEGIWLTTRGGIFQWTDARWIKHFDLPSRVFQRGPWGGMAAVNDGSAAQYGLWTWEPGRPASKVLGEERSLITTLFADSTGRAIVTHATGEVWIRHQGSWTPLTPVPAPLIHPRFIRARHNGDLWVGTDQGCFLFRAASTRWTRWPNTGDDQGNQINAIVPARDGAIWMGTGAGLFIRRPDGTQRHITTLLGLPLRVVTGLAEDPEGGIWVASGNNFSGAFRWHRGTWTHLGTEAGLDAPRIHKIVKDRRGRLWFLGLALPRAGAQAEPGAFVYDGGRFVRWTPAEGLLSGRVYDFAEGPDGAYWFATVKGISRHHNGQWRHWTTREGLHENRVFTLALDDDGRLWFGHQNAGHGLGYLDPQGHPHYLSVADGLIDNEVWSVQTGPDAALWIGTRGGLSRYRDGAFAAFGASQGLAHQHIWPVVPLKDQVYVGAIGGGLYVLNLAEEAAPPPQVLVKAPIAAAAHTQFQWRAFAHQGRQPPDAIKTRYRLDEQPWSAWSTAREASALNLSPGTHTFTVQAQSLFGTTDAAGTPITFRIDPLFYQRPLFLAGLALWVMIMAGLGLNYRRKQQRNRSLVRSTEERFARVFHASPVAIAITSLDEGRLLEINNSFLDLFGFTQDEALGRTASELGIWQDPAQRADLVSQAQGQGGLHTKVIKFRVKSGEERAIQGSLELIDLGGRKRLLWMGLDVTERERASIERERLIRELEAKNAELERFTYTVSHDLKSPLVTIKGFAGLLQQDTAKGDTERMQRDVEHIAAATDKMQRLLDELLELSRIGRLMNPPEAVSLQTLIDEALSLVAGRLVARGVEVVVVEPLPEVCGDRVRLLEVFQNLVDNAVKFMGDQRKPRIEIGARQEPEEVICWVADNGLGIDPKYREKVFGLFERLDARGEGTGIGLALVKRIVEVHGGRAWVESEGRGCGSTFYLALPASKS